MKILVLGAGNMGTWFVESMCLEHEVAVYDIDRRKLRYFFNTHRFVSLEQVGAFGPDLVINAVSLQHTIASFKEVIPYLPEGCILSDIASVKTGLFEFYKECGRRYVSTHPMFGPTFASLRELRNQSAVIIEEGDEEGKEFFKEFYSAIGVKVFSYSFEQHDSTMAYSLSIPFVSTMVFAACMKKVEVPGTTYRKHMNIAEGLFTESDYLLSEILLNPSTMPQLEGVRDKLTEVIQLVQNNDTKGLHDFIEKLRSNIA